MSTLLLTSFHGARSSTVRRLMLAAGAPALLALAFLANAGCTKSCAPGLGAPPPPSDKSDDDATTHSDGITPVYDASTQPSPRALALCDALYTLPAARKRECCKEPLSSGTSAGSGTNEIARACAGVLTDALQKKDVTLDDVKAQACIDARTAQLAGCGWIGVISPPPPPACDGILTGSLDEGARCRSNVECKRGLRCFGSSALDTGKCRAPPPKGSRCGAAVDGLAVVVGELSIARDHPDCAEGNVCALGRCNALKKAGEACRSDAECGPANRCDAQKCATGRIALGAPCTRGGCADDARCIDGACALARKAGEACSVEFDCAFGGCVKQAPGSPGAPRAPTDASGVCGMRCSSWRDVQTPAK